MSLSRLPESRAISLKASENETKLIFQSQKNEIFSEKTNLRGTLNRLVSISIGEHIPLKTRQIESWPKSTQALCLHCAEKCPSVPLFAVKYHDSKDDKYWVYGYFCRPCCSIAYIQEHASVDIGRCILWTQTALRLYFGIKKQIVAAPPRACLIKFGGKLTLDEFYGNSSHVFKTLHTPPFVTFAMYAEVTRKNDADSELGENEEVNNFKSQEKNNMTGLRRPKIRLDPIAQQEETEKPPLILEFLAKRGNLSTLIEDSNTVSSSLLTSQEINSKKNSTNEPKKKIAKYSKLMDTDPSTSSMKNNCSSGLSMYLI